jgi:hypothetical protein
MSTTTRNPPFRSYSDRWLKRVQLSPQSLVAEGSQQPPQVTIQIEAGKQIGSAGWVALGQSQTFTTALTATGTPSGGTYQWDLGPSLAFAGSSTAANTAVRGTSASGSPEDTFVRVTYTLNGQSAQASVRFTVRIPSRLDNFGQLGGPPRTSSLPTGYLTNLTYFVEDQWGELLQLGGMNVTEVLTIINRSHPVDLSPPAGTPRTQPTDLVA